MVYSSRQGDKITLTETTLSIHGLWPDLRNQNYPIVRLNGRTEVIGTCDSQNHLTLITFVTPEHIVDEGLSHQNVIAVQVSIDGGHTFSELESLDGTTLSRRSIGLLQAPQIEIVTPLLWDRKALEAITYISVTGANFGGQTLVKFYATGADGVAMIGDSVQLVHASVLSEDAMTFAADLTTPVGSSVTYEQFSFELSTNEGHSWVQFGGSIEVVVYPEVLSDHLELPINMHSTVALPVLDKRDLIRKGQLHPSFGAGINVSNVLVRSLASSLHIELVMDLEPSSDAVGKENFLVFSGEMAQEVTTNFAVSFEKALLFDTERMYYVLGGERLVINGSGFDLLQSATATFGNVTEDVQVLDDFTAGVHVEGYSGVHTLSLRHGLGGDEAALYAFTLLDTFRISQTALEGTEMLLSAHFDDEKELTGLQGIDGSAIGCQIQVNTDPVLEVQVAGLLDDETGLIHCQARDILQTSETVCHSYRAKLTVGQIETPFTGWQLFTSIAEPEILSVDAQDIQVPGSGLFNATDLHLTLQGSSNPCEAQPQEISCLYSYLGDETRLYLPPVAGIVWNWPRVTCPVSGHSVEGSLDLQVVYEDQASELIEGVVHFDRGSAQQEIFAAAETGIAGETQEERAFSLGISHFELQLGAVKIWLQEGSPLEDIQTDNLVCYLAGSQSSLEAVVPAKLIAEIGWTSINAIECDLADYAAHYYDSISIKYGLPGQSFSSDTVSLSELPVPSGMKFVQALRHKNQPVILIQKTTDAESLQQDAYCRFGDTISPLYHSSLWEGGVMSEQPGFYFCYASSSASEGSLLDARTGLDIDHFSYGQNRHRQQGSLEQSVHALEPVVHYGDQQSDANYCRLSWVSQLEAFAAIQEGKCDLTSTLASESPEEGHYRFLTSHDGLLWQQALQGEIYLATREPSISDFYQVSTGGGGVQLAIAGRNLNLPSLEVLVDGQEQSWQLLAEDMLEIGPPAYAMEDVHQIQLFMRNVASGDRTLLAEIDASFETRSNVVQVLVIQAVKDPSLEMGAAETWVTTLACQISRFDKTPIAQFAGSDQASCQVVGQVKQAEPTGQASSDEQGGVEILWSDTLWAQHARTVLGWGRISLKLQPVVARCSTERVAITLELQADGELGGLLPDRVLLYSREMGLEMTEPLSYSNETTASFEVAVPCHLQERRTARNLTSFSVHLVDSVMGQISTQSAQLLILSTHLSLQEVAKNHFVASDPVALQALHKTTDGGLSCAETGTGTLLPLMLESSRVYCEGFYHSADAQWIVSLNGQNLGGIISLRQVHAQLASRMDQMEQLQLQAINDGPQAVTIGLHQSIELKLVNYDGLGFEGFDFKCLLVDTGSMKARETPATFSAPSSFRCQITGSYSVQPSSTDDSPQPLGASGEPSCALSPCDFDDPLEAHASVVVYSKLSYQKHTISVREAIVVYPPVVLDAFADTVYNMGQTQFSLRLEKPMDPTLPKENLECLLQRQGGSKARKERARASLGDREETIICDVSHFASPLQSGAYEVWIGLNGSILSVNGLMMRVREGIEFADGERAEIFVDRGGADGPANLTFEGNFTGLQQLLAEGTCKVELVEAGSQKVHEIPASQLKIQSFNNGTQRLLLSLESLAEFVPSQDHYAQIVAENQSGQRTLLAQSQAIIFSQKLEPITFEPSISFANHSESIEVRILVPEAKPIDGCLLSSTTTLEVKLQRALSADYQNGAVWIVCEVHYPFDRLSLGKLDAVGFTEITTPVQLQYIGPVDIADITPQQGYTGTETELAITGRNLMLLLGYTRAFCAVGKNRFELTIVDHTRAFCTVQGPLAPKHTTITIAIEQENELRFTSVEVEFRFDLPPQLENVYPLVLNRGDRQLTVALDRYVSAQSSDLRCKLDKSNGESLALEVHAEGSGYEIVCQLPESVYSDEFFSVYFDYRISISMNQGYNFFEASETLRLYPEIWILDWDSQTEADYVVVSLRLQNIDAISQDESSCLLSQLGSNQRAYQATSATVILDASAERSHLVCNFSRDVFLDTMPSALWTLEFIDREFNVSSANQIGLMQSQLYYAQETSSVREFLPRSGVLNRSRQASEVWIALTLEQDETGPLQASYTRRDSARYSVDCYRAAAKLFNCTLAGLQSYIQYKSEAGCGDDCQILFQFGNYQKTLHIIDSPRIDSVVRREEGHVEVRGLSFIVESRCYRNGDHVPSFYIDETTLLCEGSVDDQWQISNNDGFEFSDVFYSEVVEVRVEGSWPTVLPVHSEEQIMDTDLYITFQEPSSSLVGGQISLRCQFGDQPSNSTQLTILNTTSGVCRVPHFIHQPAQLFVYLIPNEPLVEVTYARNIPQISFMPSLSNLRIDQPAVYLNELESQTYITGEFFISTLTYDVSLISSPQIGHDLTYETHFINSTHLLLIKDLPSAPNAFRNRTSFQVEQATVLVKYAGTVNYRLQIDQLIEIHARRSTDDSQQVIDNQQDVSIRYVTPTEIPLGHDSVTLELHGIGFQLLSGVLCSFDYELESLLSHATIVDDRLLTCGFRYPARSSQVQYTLSSVQSHQIALRIYDLGANSQIGSHELVLSPAYNIHLLSSTPQSFYLAEGIDQLDITGSNFDESCKCMIERPDRQNLQLQLEATLVDDQSLMCILGGTFFDYMRFNFRGLSAMPIQASLSIMCGDGRRSEQTISLRILPSFSLADATSISIFEDQEEISSTIGVPIEGSNLSEDMWCILEPDDGQGTAESQEVPVAKFVSHAEIECQFSGLSGGFTHAWLRLRHYNAEKPSIITDSNPVEVNILPRLKVWPRDIEYGYLFYENLDQQLILNTTLVAYSAQFTNFSAQLVCEWKSSESTVWTDKVAARFEDAIACQLPQVSPELLEDLSLTVLLEIDASILTRSNTVQVPLKRLPTLSKINPLYTPIDYQQENTIEVTGENLEEGFTYLLMRDGKDRVELDVVSTISATFKAPRYDASHAGLVSIQIATQESTSISLSQLSLQYIHLPEIHRLIPDMIPQTSISSGGEKFVIQGSNFTEFSQCVVNDSLMPTVLITGALLECAISDPAALFEPVAYSDNRLSVRVLERGLYLNQETDFTVLLTNQPYVFQIEPATVFTATVGTPVNVYVSNDIYQSSSSSYELQQQFLFCQFADNLVSKVSNVSYNVPLQDCQPPNQQTGYQKHTITPSYCRTNFTIYTCKTPYIPSAGNFQVKILNQNGQFSGSSLSDGATGPDVIRAILKSTMTGVSPHVAPYQSSEATVSIKGANFDASVDYLCTFEDRYSQRVTTASFIDDATLECPVSTALNCRTLPCFVKLKLSMEIDGQNQIPIKGQANLKLYREPTLSDIQPRNLFIDSVVKVLVVGENFQQDYGAVLCRFDEVVVSAKILRSGSLIQCEAPTLTTGEGYVPFSISIDSGFHYISNDDIQLLYLPASLTIDAVEPIVQDQWASEPIQISGQNFPYGMLTAQQENILCKFEYTGTSTVIAQRQGQILSANLMECPFERHVQPDSQVTLMLSFNGLEYILITDAIQIVEDTLTRPSIQRFSAFSSADLYLGVMQLQGIPDTCPVVSQEDGDRFHVDVVDTLWNQDIIVEVNISAGVTEIQALTTTEFLSGIEELSSEESIEGTKKIQVANRGIYFTLRYERRELLRINIYQQLYGFYNWLASQSTDILQCQDGDRYLHVTIRVYPDSAIATGANQMQMTCHVGRDPLLQDYYTREEMLAVECIQPFIDLTAEQVDSQSLEISEVTIEYLDPSVAFIDEQNIEIRIVASPLYNLQSLKCRVHDVIITAEYAQLEGETFLYCRIPSFSYLEAKTEIGLPDDNLFVVEISLDDGKTWTQQGIQFKLLLNRQLGFTDYQVGPDSGGTVVTILVEDFPAVNDQYLEAQCIFPGYEDQTDPETGLNLGIVEAVPTVGDTITCTTPPLRITDEAIENGDMYNNTIYTTVKVYVELLKQTSESYFRFTYVKDARVDYIEPPNIYFADETDRRIIVHGHHFVPATSEMFCKVELVEPGLPFVAEVPATYINNHTLSCDIPPPPSDATLPSEAWVEISFNDGQQYTQDQIIFTYTPRDSIVKTDPTRQYEMGNELVRVYTDYFFDKQSSEARCRFTVNSATVATANIIDHDDESIYCNHPPAYVYGDGYEAVQFEAELAVSSNGQDFSEPVLFTYLPEVYIETVHPPFVLMDQSVTVTLTGLNFYDNSDTSPERALKVRLSRDETDPEDSPLRVEVTETVYVDPTTVTFTFPDSIFDDKDNVLVELTFDEITWTLANDKKLTVYKQVVLTRVWPTYVYLDEAETEIYIEAGELSKEDTRGGDIWNMELFGNMLCRFQSQLDGLQQLAQARYFNQTHVGCSIPVYTAEETIQVDLTLDEGITYSANQVPVILIAAPVISELNNTAYFYTFTEQVYIEVKGSNLDHGEYLYIRVGDQVQRIEEVAKVDGFDSIVFKMPVQLDMGTYDITVSTDGQNYRPEDSSTFQVTIEKCPDGYYCRQETAVICPDGHFCPHDEPQMFQPRECPLGTYMTGEGAHECVQCGVGSYCPDVRLYVEQACPVGFLCESESMHSLAQLPECPAGYICPSGTSSLNSEDLLTEGNMQRCPDGHYCPKGTMQAMHQYGNFSTPQVCKDGVICGQTKELDNVSDMPGSTSQYGNFQCQAGTYCESGIAKSCPAGHICPKFDMPRPVPCMPGYYQENTNQTQCDACPYGTFCFGAGLDKPIKCTPGWTCQLEGSQAPAQLCPAGSFCHQATVSNQTNSTAREFYKPNFCFASTYCLAGAYTPFVDVDNEQAAQDCIAGTFCGAGSASPEGKGKCKEGFYCPPGSLIMIPTEPGFFAEGSGNVAAEKCRPGTWQDERQQARCKECPKGHYCPSQQMTEKLMCPEGTFAKLEGQTQCANCPLGAYSDELALESEDDCQPCLPRYRCTATGLRRMQEAERCQEGYWCSYGTTTTVMLQSQVERGYFGGYSISGKAEYFLCPEGKYCPDATAESKVAQLDCLRGFFCPLGTAADLDLYGNFNPGVQQVDKQLQIVELEAFLKETKAAMAAFEELIEARSIEARLDGFLEDGDLKNWYRLDWQNTMYKMNLTIVEERANYNVSVLYNETICPEDLLLPDELIRDYIQNGTNLICPKGTFSERGSRCLGQCVINLASKIPVSELNPVIDVIGTTSRDDREDSAYYQEGTLGSLADRLAKERRLQDIAQKNTTRIRPHLNDAERDFGVVGGGVFDTLHRQVVQPLEIAVINIDFRELPPKFLYNDHFAVLILDEQGEPYKIPDYLVSRNNGITKKRELLKIQVFNWRETPQEFQVGFHLYHGLFVPYLELLSDKVWIELKRAERQAPLPDRTYAAVIGEVLLEGKTMPYNAVDYGVEANLWLDFVSQGDEIVPTTKGLDKDAFDPTFWQSKQISAIVMPWIPYFSNCDGFDSHMIFYDLLEYSEKCELPKYSEMSIVSPIPASGLQPNTDKCQFTIPCRYDEDLTYKRSQTVRWYALQEETRMFYVTRSPVPVANFHELEDSDTVQTVYNTLLEDGSDDIIPVPFIPGQLEGIPRTVEIDLLYYQATVDLKYLQSMTVRMTDYTDDEFDEDGKVNSNYQIKLNYEALDWFQLVNNFQFDVPIYVLLFNVVAIVLILGVLAFWVLNLMCARIKDPPALRFKHLARVTFANPAIGTLLSAVPALIVCMGLRAYQQSSLFAQTPSNWMDLGSELSNKTVVAQRRGRIGICLIFCSFVFLTHGASSIIHVPTESDEGLIVENNRRVRRKQAIDLSIGEEEMDDDVEEREDNTNIREALVWKRKHFFVICLFVGLFLMLKLEFSYTRIFSGNIMLFLALFMVGDMIIEQLLVRLVMSEALLVAPLLGTFVICEFVMTMGAENLRAFIISYFVETTIVVVSRVYIGPWVEKLEVYTQTAVIGLAQRYLWARDLFRNILVKQLATQLQLMSLTEFHDRKVRAGTQEEEDREKSVQKKRKLFAFQSEKGEGSEALLGSVLTYSSQTQALFLIPFVLLFIMTFANETKIPQNYGIRLTDLQYYFTFCAVIVVPQLAIDVFILHILEISQGYKIYDYFTYCQYRFNFRQEQWLSQAKLDKSIIHAFRSLDALCFSSQYYYFISLTTWGIIFLYLGVTAVIRNASNPFADPTTIFFGGVIAASALPVKWSLGAAARVVGLWKLKTTGRLNYDDADKNRLDEGYAQKRLIRNVQTNPFRHKFVVLNREWVITNIATILGGRSYLAQAGAELDYLKHIYQAAVNQQAVNQRLAAGQEELGEQLKLLPYNQIRNNEMPDVSSSNLSDEPIVKWDLPEALATPHVFRIAQMWLDFARASMRLKFMVADIVKKKLRSKCQKCKERYRLQVIQKVDFQALTRKYRKENIGIPFTKARWRRYYKRNQVFLTLCMECAYIDNLEAGQLHNEDVELQTLMAQNALKHIGAASAIVAKKLEHVYVRKIIFRWLMIARASLLHKQDEEQQVGKLKMEQSVQDDELFDES